MAYLSIEAREKIINLLLNDYVNDIYMDDLLKHVIIFHVSDNNFQLDYNPSIVTYCTYNYRCMLEMWAPPLRKKKYCFRTNIGILDLMEAPIPRHGDNWMWQKGGEILIWNSGYDSLEWLYHCRKEEAYDLLTCNHYYPLMSIKIKALCKTIEEGVPLTYNDIDLSIPHNTVTAMFIKKEIMNIES